MGRKKHKRKRASESVDMPRKSSHFPKEVQDEAESLFKKLFRYHLKAECAEWSLPQENTMFTSPPWKDAVLDKHKEALNTLKSKLSDYDINKWHAHTQYTNKAGCVNGHIRRTIKPELCTQAWCKFYEIVSGFDIVPQCDEFVSAHICEAPGAFITSLNHHLNSKGTISDWHWIGSTLNPYYEGNGLAHMIADDRLILDTIPHWYFGEDNTGDLMESRNIFGFLNHMSTFGYCQLVTADGSIDCANNPDAQEELTAQLHYCEIVAALNILSPGGSLVIKMFTMFEHTSVCNMYLLNNLFREVNVFKPATSKSGNSEVYIIARQFKGIPESLLVYLRKFTGPVAPVSALFSQHDIPESFIEQHRECCRVFSHYQMDTIQENMDLYNHVPNTSPVNTEHTNQSANTHPGECTSSDDTSLNTNSNRSTENQTNGAVKEKTLHQSRLTDSKAVHLRDVKQCCCLKYVELYKLTPIPVGARIVPYYNNVKCPKLDKINYHQGRKKHEGSYKERIYLKDLPWVERLQKMDLYDIDSSNLSFTISGMDVLETTNFNETCIVTGKKIDKVQSSKFCDQFLLQHYNEMVRNSQTDAKESKSLESVDTNCCLQDKRSDNNQTADVASHVSTLPHIIQLIQNMTKESDVCVLVPPGLTRMNVSLVFFFYCHFNQVTYLPLKSQDKNEMYIEASTYKGCTADLMKYLKAVSSKICTQLDSSVLQYYPMELIIESNFFEWLYNCNNDFLQRQINRMITSQKSQHNQIITHNDTYQLEPS